MYLPLLVLTYSRGIPEKMILYFFFLFASLAFASEESRNPDETAKTEIAIQNCIFGGVHDLSLYFNQFIDTASLKTVTLINKSSALIENRPLIEITKRFKDIYGSDALSLPDGSYLDYVWFMRFSSKDVLDSNFWKVVIFYCSPDIKLNCCKSFAHSVALNLLNDTWTNAANYVSKYFDDFIYILFHTGQYHLFFELCRKYHGYYSSDWDLIVDYSNALYGLLNDLEASKLNAFLLCLQSEQLVQLFQQIVTDSNHEYLKLFEAMLPFILSFNENALFSTKISNYNYITSLKCFYPKQKQFDYSIINSAIVRYLKPSEKDDLIFHYLNTGEFDHENYFNRFPTNGDIDGIEMLYKAALAKEDIVTIAHCISHFQNIYHVHSMNILNIFDKPEVLSVTNIQLIYSHGDIIFMENFMQKCLKSYPEDESFQNLVKLVDEGIDLPIKGILSNDIKLFEKMIWECYSLNGDLIYVMIGVLVTDPIILEHYLLLLIDGIPGSQIPIDSLSASLIFSKISLSNAMHLMKNSTIRNWFAPVALDIKFRDYKIDELMNLFRVELYCELMYPFRMALLQQSHFLKIIFHLETIEEALLYLKYYHDLDDPVRIFADFMEYRNAGIDLIMEAGLRQISTSLHFLKGDYLCKAIKDSPEEVQMTVSNWIAKGQVKKAERFLLNTSSLTFTASFEPIRNAIQSFLRKSGRNYNLMFSLG